MKKEAQYTLARLRGVPYLLPFGQNVAGMRRGFRLNEVGAFVWDALDTAQDRAALEAAYLSFTGATPEQRAEALADLDAFLKTLRGWGVLLSDAGERDAAPELCLRIGPLALKLCGPPDVFAPELRAFAAHCAALPCQSVTVTQALPPERIGARYVLQSRELEVLRREDEWLLALPPLTTVRLALLSEDGTRAVLHVRPAADAAAQAKRREEVFHALRHLFLYFAQRQGCFALHSASVCYKDRALLFSAPSGTGKSTHAALWERECGASPLNGDLGLLALSGDGAAFYGMPWCGTSGIFTTDSLPLGGVVLLRQGKRNALVPLTADERQLRVLNRLISPVWTREQLARSLSFTEELTRRVPVRLYDCTPEPESARLLRAELDRALEARP